MSDDEDRERLLESVSPGSRVFRQHHRRRFGVQLALAGLVGVSILAVIARVVMGEGFTSILAWQSKFAPDRTPGYAGPPPVICDHTPSPLEEALLQLQARSPPAGQPDVIWTSSRRPEDIADRLQKSWTDLNPEWTYRILGDEEAREVIVSAFGQDPVLQQILRTYDAAPRVVMRIDILRYALLWLHGGVWTDSDTVCMQPVNDWTPSDATPHTVLAVERDTPYRIDPDWLARGWTAPDRGYQLVQWTMKTQRFSPVMRRALLIAVKRAEEHQGPMGDSDILYVTGPRALTDAALETVACEVDPQPFSWLNVTEHTQAVTIGGVSVLPPHSFDANPARTERGKAQLVEHLYSGSWKVTAY